MKKLLGLLLLTLSFLNAKAQNEETILEMWCGEINNTDVSEHLELEKRISHATNRQRRCPWMGYVGNNKPKSQCNDYDLHIRFTG